MGVETRAAALFLALLTAFGGMAAPIFETYDPASITVLVNTEHKLPYSYEPTVVMPNVLSAPGKGDSILLRQEAATALEAMFAEAKTAGHTLYAVSGYRSYYAQKSLFQNKVNIVGEKKAAQVVAPPGTSEHQLGLVMDVNGESTLKSGLEEDFGASAEGHWIAENAHRFGFIVRYPKDKTHITGYTWEPWHLRYIGLEAAEEVYTLDITFDEYHRLLQQRRLDAWKEVPEEDEKVL